MCKNPLVSIITPAFNARATIGYTIESVLSQTFSDFEMIIVDDGSTDNTAQLINNIKDERIVYIFQSNKDRAEARNHGIGIARGDYIAFLDSDDLWMQDKLEKQVPLLDENPEIGLVYSDLYYFAHQTGEDLLQYSKKVKLHKGTVPVRLIIERNFIQSPTPIIRREVFEEVGLFDTCLIPVEDWDMWIRIVAKFPIDFIDEPLARYRVHENAILWSQYPEKQYSAVNKMLDKVEHHFDAQNTAIKSGINRGRALANYVYGLTLLNTCNYNEARSYFFEALKINPLLLQLYVRLLQLSLVYVMYIAKKRLTIK